MYNVIPCGRSAAPSPGLIPSPDRTAWISTQILPHESALRAWLRRRASHGLEVDDLVQETYALLAGLAAVDHIRSPKAYAFQTAQSLILRHLRRSKVVRMETVGDLADLHLRDDGPSPESRLAAHQQLMRARQVILAMPARRREAFILRKFEGLSQRQIAQRMGIAQSTVEKHIAQALRALMSALSLDAT